MMNIVSNGLMRSDRCQEDRVASELVQRLCLVLVESAREAIMEEEGPDDWNQRMATAVAEEVVITVIGWLDSDRDEEFVTKHWDAIQLIAKEAEAEGLDLERGTP